MRLKHRSALRWLALSVLGCCVPVAVFALAHPTATLKTLGFTCSAQTVCTDDPRRLDEALALYDEAFKFVSASVAPLEANPIVIFCATSSCYSFTGEPESAAKTVGKYIIVIAPRGWKPYVVRHEFIHRVQGERLGIIGMYRRPEWYIEGMAYALSEDPRDQLRPPYQGERARFQAWYTTVGKERMWSAESPK
jgi:hypothetical protein